ncbi:MAG: hypothetical protein K2X27_07800, partial [Candidatus Obscuribacterales bacterium]|nr:hypothetical protein [Candidatus Obscuribacterales bacterium]
FGELMRRKLPHNETMVTYLSRRVLQPAGISYGAWRNGSDGFPLIPQGAQFSAREWAKFGELIRNHGRSANKQILEAADVDELFRASSANPMYGLSWWLNRPMKEELRNNIKQLTMSSDLQYGIAGLPDDLVMAAGAGKQRLYIVPSMNLVVVRQADRILQAIMNEDRGSFSDICFWQLLTLGKSKSPAGTEALPETIQQSSRARRILDLNHDGKIDERERAALRERLQKRFHKQ